ncbi:MAG TPA: type II toxin-antitoxin system RatA family toxin [Chromatiales bacterium]|nr:type II toxin-antitoxin system RatA family toxin [Chromatiales bacterium]
MIRKSAQGVLPYPCEQVYAVVADVERYPEFVPGWLDAKIVAHGDEGLRVEQELRLGPASWRFESVARLDRPHRIHIHAASGPFETLSIQWRFEPLGTGCRVALELTARMRPRLLEGPYGALLDRQAEMLWNVFARRVARLQAG